MPIKFIQQKKRQKYLIMIIPAVIVVTLIVLWFGYLKKPAPVSEPGPAGAVSGIEINFQVLENPILMELQPFEEPAPFEDEKGRENPFLPY